MATYEPNRALSRVTLLLAALPLHAELLAALMAIGHGLVASKAVALGTRRGTGAVGHRRGSRGGILRQGPPPAQVARVGEDALRIASALGSKDILRPPRINIV